MHTRTSGTRVYTQDYRNPCALPDCRHPCALPDCRHPCAHLDCRNPCAHPRLQAPVCTPNTAGTRVHSRNAGTCVHSRTAGTRVYAQDCRHTCVRPGLQAPVRTPGLQAPVCTCSPGPAHSANKDRPEGAPRADCALDTNHIEIVLQPERPLCYRGMGPSSHAPSLAPRGNQARDRGPQETWLPPSPTPPRGLRECCSRRSNSKCACLKISPFCVF